jgi:glyoxylase-like metal-dependent hydrolase (beta-lactamase superfamily II)
MSKKYTISGALLTAGLVWVLTAQQSDLKSVVDQSLRAMGAENLKTVVYSGEGMDACVGQTYNPSLGWRKFSNKNYVRSIDFDAKGWRIQRIRGEGEIAPKLGGCSDRPVPDAPQNQVTIVTPSSPWNNQLEYIFLPVGFLRVALEKNATVKSETVKGKKYTVLSFVGDNKAPVNGYINDQGYVERVSTMIDNNFLGDTVWEAVYAGWKDFGGVKFPTHIMQNQGGYPFVDLKVSDVKPNAPVDLTQQAKGGFKGGDGKAKGADGKGKGGPPVAPPPGVEELGGGFYLVTGGYASVIGDFKDYLVVIEAGQNEARSEQVLAVIKSKFPGKPIKYVINTHSHFDHTGGLRTFVAEGATIVTHQANKGYYEKIFANPHTLVPDRLSQMKPQPKTKVEYAGEKKTYSDGEHVIELYHVKDTTHADNMMIVYLPKQKVLIEADEFNTFPANTQVTAENRNPYHANLLATLEKLKLDIDRIIPIHLPNDGRKITLAELKTASGRQ